MNQIPMTKTRHISICISLAVFMAACSNGPLVKEIAITTSPVEEVKNLDTDLHAAYAKQINVLSPTNYRDAESSLEAAKRKLNDKKDTKDILHQVALGRHYLERSYEVAKLSDTYMEEVVAARREAIGAGAPNIVAGEFRDADRHLRNVTVDLEKNETKSTAENRAKLQQEFLALELKAIKHNYLGQSKDLVHQAVVEGAKQYAPRSLSIAEKNLIDVDAFIIANRHETEKLTTRSNEVLASANHVLKITRAAKSGEKTSSEDLALQIENGQNQVVDRQNELQAKQNQLQDKQAQLANEQGKLTALSSENRVLESSKAINKVFEDAQGVFTKNEAEVYKQDGTLKIRLKGLEFPTSQAVLKGSNFPLLAKVQKVIQGFGKSSIVVEGYTDSLGDRKLNTKLSLNRAQAVREYLISNNNVSADDIKAVGYGYQKPIASNRTVEGRAQNRRVDILIKPEEI